MLRVFLIIVLTLSASLSGAVAADHVVMPDHDHSVVETTDNDQPACCEGSTERAPNCLVMPAMVDSHGAFADEITARSEAFAVFERTLTGIELSGPFDPPRMV